MLTTILAVNLWALVNARQFMATTTPMSLYEAQGKEISIQVDTWLEKLSNCESGGNWKALNPKDTDGTPSKGKFQFKDGTFSWLSKKYEISTTSIWNGDEQEQLVRRMIVDPDIKIQNQFPGCVRKIGLPPVTTE